MSGIIVLDDALMSRWRHSTAGNLLQRLGFRTAATSPIRDEVYDHCGFRWYRATNEELAEELHLTVDQVRYALAVLVLAGVIVRERHYRGSRGWRDRTYSYRLAEDPAPQPGKSPDVQPGKSPDVSPVKNPVNTQELNPPYGPPLAADGGVVEDEPEEVVEVDQPELFDAPEPAPKARRPRGHARRYAKREARRGEADILPLPGTQPTPDVPALIRAEVERAQSVDAAFEQWWGVWPLPDGTKEAARKLWPRALADAGFDVLMRGAYGRRRWFDLDPVEHKRWCPSPVTWLRDRKWSEEWWALRITTPRAIAAFEALTADIDPVRVAERERLAREAEERAARERERRRRAHLNDGSRERAAARGEYWSPDDY